VLYARPPTPEEAAALRRMTRQAVGRVAERARLVLLSAAGRPVPELARLFGLTGPSVRRWLHRFNAAGPAGLYDAPRPGRPRTRPPPDRAAVASAGQTPARPHERRAERS
jgi:transposase